MSKLVLGAVAVAAWSPPGSVSRAWRPPPPPSRPLAASSAPAVGRRRPAPVPVPLVYQPVDASDGLYGMRRGSVPTASTADLSPVPIANRLPVIGVTPLPARSTDDGVRHRRVGRRHLQRHGRIHGRPRPVAGQVPKRRCRAA